MKGCRNLAAGRGGVGLLSEREHEQEIDTLGGAVGAVGVGASAIEVFYACLQACRHVPEEVGHAIEAVAIGRSFCAVGKELGTGSPIRSCKYYA